MPGRPSWWERLELRRTALQHSVRDVAGLIGTSPQTIYNWNQGSRADSPDAVRGLADYLNEDFPALWAELRREPDTSTDALLRTYAARDLNAAYAQARLATLAAVLDPLGVEPADPLGQQGPRRAGIEDVDVVLQQLRRTFPDAELGVLQQRRGRRHRRSFQYALLVRDTDRTPDDVTARLRAVLRRLRLPTSIEHSLELVPESWRDYPVVLVPVHLAARTALWDVNLVGGMTAMVLGVWYAGAPDAAARAADVLHAGYDSITNLAALSGDWDVSSARQHDALMAQQTRLAEQITSAESPYSGPFIWANNDVPPLLAPAVVRQLQESFPGRLVLIELHEEVLAYAAYRTHTATGQPIQQCLAQLRDWQDQLMNLAHVRTERYRDGNGEMPDVGHVLLTLPDGVKRLDEEAWPDAVDAFFDKYVEVGEAIAKWLQKPRGRGWTEITVS